MTGSATKQSILPLRCEMDCFASLAMTGMLRAYPMLSYPRMRVSSTPRPFESITDVSGILDRPLSRTMTTEYVSAFSRREAPEVLHERCPSKREGAGNAGCALHPRSRVQNCTKRNAHEHTGSAETLRHSPRNGLTAYAALSPATNSSCHRHWRIKVCRSPVGPTRLRRLGISNGCQDHTVLPYAPASFVLRAG